MFRRAAACLLALFAVLVPASLAHADDTAYRSSVLSDTPLGFWPLNGSSTASVPDASGNGNTLTGAGTVTTGVTGPMSGSTGMAFGGGSLGRSYFNYTNNFAIELWARSNRVAEREAIVSNGWVGTSDNCWHGIVAVGDGANAAGYDANTCGDGGWAGYGATFASSSDWHHIVVQRVSGTTSTWVDGVQRSATDAHAVTLGGGSFRIGSFQDLHYGDGNGTSASFATFRGAVAHVAYYNHTLTGTRIAAHYNAAVGPPANSAAPTVSPSALIGPGIVLRADPGTWTGASLTYAYQWQRCAADGTGCADIAGATSSAYTLQGDDAGHAIRVKVTATSDQGSTSTTSAATGAVAVQAPRGSALYAQSVLDDTPLGFWPLNGSSTASVPDATGHGYTLTGAGSVTTGVTGPMAGSTGMGFAGGSLGRSYFNYTNNFAIELWARSNRVAEREAIVSNGWVGTSDNCWHGILAVGDGANVAGYNANTCGDGGWAGYGSVFGSTSDWHHVVVQRVSGTTSTWVDGVQRAATDTHAVTLGGGSFRIGSFQDLHYGDGNGTPSGSFGPFRGAVAQVAYYNHTLTAAEIADHYNSAIGAPTANTPPSIDPKTNLHPGDQLTADPGTWAGSGPFTYTYRWRACDADGTNCADISGATAATFTLTAAQVGKAVKVVVTATNALGTGTVGSAATSAVVASAPQSQVAPAISGTTTDGATLTSTTGDWTGATPIAYSRQWRRCDADGTNCADISGATGDTYALTPADVGHALRVVVTATNSAGATNATSAATAAVAAAAPANTAVPAVSGTAVDGATLTAAHGTWSGTAPITYTYRWRRCDAAGSGCADISGATSDTYAVTSTDVGHALRVVVTATNAAGSVDATSAATDAIAAAAPSNDERPAVSGTTTDGETLTVAVGDWSGTTPISYARQWQRCDAVGADCAPISGATGITYAAGANDVGHALRVAVTATNSVGSADATSLPTAAIAAAPPHGTGLPVVSGTAAEGATLTATDGTWSGTEPLSYTYQWRRCDADGTGCADVAGATAATRVLTGGDVGHALRVTVTATNAAGADTATSAATAVVDGTAPANASAPTVDGIATDGETLTGHVGDWTGTAPIDHARQWLRCDAAGADCAPIAGADGADHVLGSDDVGFTLRLKVTATNAAGSADATSEPTAVVAAVAPAPLTDPEVFGDATVGATLTATPGGWSGTTPLSYTYQWQRCAADGTACDDVPGAWDPDYVATPGDEGAALRVHVTATNAAGSADATSAATAPIAPAEGGGGDELQATVPPAVHGTLAGTGTTLTADTGTWSSDAPLSYTYQWQRCAADGADCEDVAGATGPTYATAAGDEDGALRVVVTATDGAATADAASAAVDPAFSASISAKTQLYALQDDGHGYIFGDQPISVAHAGDWRPDGDVSFTYQWRSCDAAGEDCHDLSAARSLRYEAQDADAGHTLRVVVTAHAYGSTVAVASPATAAVTLAAPRYSRNLQLLGVAQVGHALTVMPGEWSPTPDSYTYRWQRCDDAGTCADVEGATADRLVLTTADLGHRVKVIVTAHTSGGDGSASGQTALITVPALGSTAPPVVTIAPGPEGDRAHVTTGTWTGATGADHRYQWQRCDAEGAHCRNIPGAGAADHDVDAADVGGTLRAAVTATIPGHALTARSAVTAVIGAPAPAAVTAPTVAGTAGTGRTVTADGATWSGPGPLAHAYRWQLCDATGASCEDLDDEDGPELALSEREAGGTVRVIASVHGAGGDAQATSAVSALVATTAPGPVADTPPAVSGSAAVGQTLTATAGDWDGTGTVATTSAWLRCDVQGRDCAAIDGATGSTYTLTAADVEATLVLEVTATDDEGIAIARSAATGIVRSGTGPAPLVAPAISGTATEGQVLTAGTGEWAAPETLTFAYQWQRCDAAGACADILEAEDATYTVDAADAGAQLRVRVVADDGDEVATTFSAPTTAITAVGPRLDAAPSITGAARAGATLTGDDGQWRADDELTDLTRRWQRCDDEGQDCADISGATDATYVPVAADLGATLRLVVAATDATGTREGTSLPTDVVVAGDTPLATAAPAITGDVQEGETVTAAHGTWAGDAPISYTYQWQRCDVAQDADDQPGCTAIEDATADTYVPTGEDVGFTLQVLVTAHNGAGAVTATAATTVAVADAQAAGGTPHNAALPTLAGEARSGATLTVANGGWTGATQIGFDQRWLRCDSAGESCETVGWGAERDATDEDVGHRLRVRVTASSAWGSASALSAPSAVIAARAPVQQSDPAISGTFSDGQTLTADAGSWLPATTTTHLRWQRCADAEEPTDCQDIDGAEGDDYVTTAEDVGARLRLRVTAVSDGGTTIGTSAVTPAIVHSAPVAVNAPWVSGVPRQDGTLTVQEGWWQGLELSIAHQWQRCDEAGESCEDISGATSDTYTLTAADLGATVRVVSTATNDSGSASATSGTTSPVLEAAAPQTRWWTPSSYGDPHDGQQLVADPGDWDSVDPLTFGYRWQRCDEGTCADIAGATEQAYTLATADVGHQVRVVVTATNPTGSTELAADPWDITSSAPEAQWTPSLTGWPLLAGTELSVDDGGWVGSGPITYTYAWQRCDAAGEDCGDIAGATAATYTLTHDDDGHRVKATVTATNALGAEHASTDPSDAVGGVPPANDDAPWVDGNAAVGRVVTAQEGDWTPAASWYEYQWLRCADDGTACAPIDDATGRNYAPTTDDLAKTLRVRVTAAGAAGKTTAESAPSARVNRYASFYPTPVPTVPPSLPTGTPDIGAPITVDPGVWTANAPITFSYQWYYCTNGGACSRPWTPDEHDRTFTPDWDSLNWHLRVKVTATTANGSNYAYTNTTPELSFGVPRNLTPPSWEGSDNAFELGHTVRPDLGRWSGVDGYSFTYVWQRCDAEGSNCAPIGVTNDNYTLRGDDVGHTLRVVLTAKTEQGQQTVTTPASDVVADVGPPANQVRPHVTGDARVGEQLTADPGTWDRDDTSFLVSWERCDADGRHCALISSTARPEDYDLNYRVRHADEGHTLRAAVAGTTAGGTTTVRSATTAVVEAPPPLSNLILPTVPGYSQGAPLQVARGTAGLWSADPELVDQWQRCDPTAVDPDTGEMPCVDIAGETDAGYHQLLAEDVGYKLRLKETATTPDGQEQTVYSTPGSTVGQSGWQGAGMTLSGPAAVGQELTATVIVSDTIVPLTKTYTFRWPDGTVRQDGTSPAYTPVADDAGKRLYVSAEITMWTADHTRVLRTLDAGATSDSVDGPLAADGTPQIDGTPIKGATLTAVPQWVGGGDAPDVTYQWRRCDATGDACEDIDGATDDTYTLVAADVGTTLRYVAVATLGGASVTATSAASGAVTTPAAPVDTTAPSISGTARELQTLTADPGQWDGGEPITYTYQWTSCVDGPTSCAPIDGATRATYVLSGDQVTNTIRVQVTATNAAGSSTAVSDATGVVDGAPDPVADNDPRVTLLGPATEAATALADAGDWENVGDGGISYQWQRCVTGGTGCEDITGADARNYDLGAADVGHQLRVQVTGANSSSAVTATSELTPTITASLGSATDKVVFLVGGEIHLAGPDGSADHVVADCATLGLASDCSLHMPRISPNQQVIAVEDRHVPSYWPDNRGEGTIVLVNYDGSGARVLGPGSDPSWSADGLDVLETVASPGGGTDIASVAADGSSDEPTPLLAHQSGVASQPELSADGQKLLYIEGDPASVGGGGGGGGATFARATLSVFEDEPTTAPGLYMADASGETSVQLPTPDDITDVTTPRFSGDETKVYYNAYNPGWADGSGAHRLWSMNSDGTDSQMLNPLGDDDYGPGSGDGEGHVLTTKRHFAADYFGPGVGFTFGSSEVVTIDGNGEVSGTDFPDDVTDLSHGPDPITHGMGSGADTVNEVVEAVRPKLLFDGNEQWRPLDVKRFLKEPGMQVCQKHWRRVLAQHGTYYYNKYYDDGCKHTAVHGLYNGMAESVGSDGSHWGMPQIRIPSSYRSPYLASCLHASWVQDCERGSRSKMYYNVSRFGDLVYVDWWFYMRNNPPLKGADAHSGDWEGVTTVWSTTQHRVVQVGFAQHRGVYRYLKGVTQLDGNRARVYVARNSHASYPRPCSSNCHQDKLNSTFIIKAANALLSSTTYTSGIARNWLGFAKNSALPENSTNGRFDWAQNSDAACYHSGERCIEPLTTTNRNGNPLFPVWPGRWGEIIDDAPFTDPPKSPGNQGRFTNPRGIKFSENYKSAASGGRAAVSTTAGEDDESLNGCDAYSGAMVVALACDETAVEQSALLDTIDEPGTATLTSDADGFNADAAPGVAQATATGDALAAGESVTLEGTMPATTTLRVVVDTPKGPVAVQQGDLGLQDGGAVTATADPAHPGQLTVVRTPPRRASGAARIISAKRVGSRVQIVVTQRGAAATPIAVLDGRGRRRAGGRALKAGRQTVVVRDPHRRARWVRIGGAGQGKAVRVRIR